MDKRKRTEIDPVNTLASVEYLCPRIGRLTKFVIRDHDLDSYSLRATAQGCDCCGGHERVWVEIEKCPSCGKPHRIELKSW